MDDGPMSKRVLEGGISRKEIRLGVKIFLHKMDGGLAFHRDFKCRINGLLDRAKGYPPKL